MEILKREFAQLMDAYGKGEENPLSPLPVQYKDYTQWYNHRLSGENLKEHRDYWTKTFEGGVPSLGLPADYPRPKLKSFTGEYIRFSLNKEITGGLRRIAGENNTTLYVVFLSLMNVLLYRYTGQGDIVIGTPVAGRVHEDLESQIGFYINMLALRNKLEPGLTFREFLQGVRSNTFNVFEHQLYPFDLLVRELNLAREPGRNPLFDVVLTLITNDNQSRNADDSYPTGETGDEDLVESGLGDIKHDLRVRINDRGGHMIVSIHYNSLIFKKERIMILRERLLSLADSIIFNPDEDIDNLDFLSEIEKIEEEDKFHGAF